MADIGVPAGWEHERSPPLTREPPDAEQAAGMARVFKAACSASPPARLSRAWPARSSAARPKVLSVDGVQASDAVIGMGCGDACPVFSSKGDEDWQGIDAESLPGRVTVPNELRRTVVRRAPGGW
ncbi:hypothetical protein [Nonomuraea sp. NPDC049758]|uniref:hypothetical protein n=1 Tax=Nonomuraea sp. NPDC049758 TaxID=3154360 RepID=UPI00343C6BAF